jgi:hypothetical protein
MLTMPGNGSRFRAFAVLTGAALALHQLRYLLAYGGQSEKQLGLQAHAYLALIFPLAVVLVAVAVLAFGVSMLRAHRAMRGEPGLPTGLALWARSSCILLGVYGLQEWLEGELGHGHPSGIGAIVGRGGWWAVPLAIALGALVAWLLKGAASAIELVANRSRTPRRFVRSSAPSRHKRPSQKPAIDVLASFLAGRGPPLAPCQALSSPIA